MNHVSGNVAKDEWLRLTPEPLPLAQGKRWNVFLSYRSVNRPWVLNLYDVLRERGHAVFLDQVALVGGTQLIGSLRTNLKASQAGILIWSAAAADSAWVEKEYEVMEATATSDEDFHFVPIRLDDTELPGFADLRIFFDFAQYPDGPNGGELMRLLHAIVGQPLSEDAARFAAEQDVTSRKIAAAVDAAIANGDGDRLLKLFADGGLSWKTTAVLGCRAAEGLTRLGRHDDAIAVLQEVEADFPAAIRPKQLHALALAKRGGDGDLSEAQQILGALEAEGHKDPETLGIYGRTWMDRYAATGDPLSLKRSRNLYAEAFDGAGDDYYTGINAAAKSVLLGGDDDVARGRELARRVEAIVGTEARAGDYWQTATAAEVQLILGNWDAAAALYADAVEMAPAERDSHRSTWTQACRLMRKLEPAEDARARVREAFSHLPDCGELLAGEPEA